MERTFVMIKPDAVQRGLIGEIISRFERRGIKIIAMKFMDVSDELAGEHYEALASKPFYKDLIKYITSGPVVAMVLEGTNVIKAARNTMGITNPADAAAGTIRADLALEVGRNVIHGSDSVESAAKEIELWFGKDIPDWKRNTDKWIFE
jgi:nucleoside-diphosphate kinase